MEKTKANPTLDCFKEYKEELKVKGQSAYILLGTLSVSLISGYLAYDFYNSADLVGGVLSSIGAMASGVTSLIYLPELIKHNKDTNKKLNELEELIKKE